MYKTELSLMLLYRLHFRQHNVTVMHIVTDNDSFTLTYSFERKLLIESPLKYSDY